MNQFTGLCWPSRQTTPLKLPSRESWRAERSDNWSRKLLTNRCFSYKPCILWKTRSWLGMAPDIDSNSPDMYSVAFVGFDDYPAWVDSKRK